MRIASKDRFKTVDDTSTCDGEYSISGVDDSELCRVFVWCHPQDCQVFWYVTASMLDETFHKKPIQLSILRAWNDSVKWRHPNDKRATILHKDDHPELVDEIESLRRIRLDYEIHKMLEK